MDSLGCLGPPESQATGCFPNSRAWLSERETTWRFWRKFSPRRHGLGHWPRRLAVLLLVVPAFEPLRKKIQKAFVRADRDEDQIMVSGSTPNLKVGNSTHPARHQTNHPSPSAQMQMESDSWDWCATFSQCSTRGSGLTSATSWAPDRTWYWPWRSSSISTGTPSGSCRSGTWNWWTKQGLAWKQRKRPRLRPRPNKKEKNSDLLGQNDGNADETKGGRLSFGNSCAKVAHNDAIGFGVSTRCWLPMWVWVAQVSLAGGQFGLSERQERDEPAAFVVAMDDFGARGRKVLRLFNFMVCLWDTSFRFGHDIIGLIQAASWCDWCDTAWMVSLTFIPPLAFTAMGLIWQHAPRCP